MLRLAFDGAAHTPDVVGLREVAARYSFFLGANAALWRSGVRGFESLVYREVWPGIDLVFRWSDGVLTYDAKVASGADPNAIRLRCKGSERPNIDANGTLAISTSTGILRQRPPLAWQQTSAGERVPMPSSFRVFADGSYGFDVHGRNSGLSTTIDPGLEWSTYLGGTGADDAVAVALSPDGTITVAGSTQSPAFPTTPGVFDTTYAGPSPWTDVFVCRFSPSGELLLSTYLGGSLLGVADYARDVAVVESGLTTVTGVAGSSDFPTTPGAFDQTNSSGLDIFVTRLNQDFSQLVFSTFIGGSLGSGSDFVDAMSVLPNGQVAITGQTKSIDYPVTPGAYDTTPDTTALPFAGDAFVTMLAADGASLVFSTLLGGVQADGGGGVACDADGSVVVVGGAAEDGFPTTPGAYDNDPHRIFVARFDSTGSRLMAATFLGGSVTDIVYDVALGPDGSITLAGFTDSPDFPTTAGAFQPTVIPGNQAVFVTRMDPTLSSLVWSTYVGGHSVDQAKALVVDSAGVVTFAGRTRSGGYPTTPGAFLESKQGGFTYDTVVSRLSQDGARLLYSTYLGGTDDDPGTGWDHIDVAVGPEGEAVVVGSTESSNFPTTPGAFDTTMNSSVDATVSKLSMLPLGVTKYGASTPGCKGSLWASVTAQPKLGSTGFGITCTNADSSGSSAILVVGIDGLSAPIHLKGTDLWVNAHPQVLLIPVGLDSFGYAELPAPLPKDAALVNLTIYAQFFVPGSDCTSKGWAASNALGIELLLP